MKTTPLPELAPGRLGRIVSVDAPEDWRSRLASMGVAPGEIVERVGGSTHGPCLIACKSSRLALRREMAMGIVVQAV